MTEITPDTRLTDRELIVHLVQHVEAMHDRIEQLCDELEAFRPLLARFRPPGSGDYLTLMQAARELRRNGRARP